MTCSLKVWFKGLGSITTIDLLSGNTANSVKAFKLSYFSSSYLSPSGNAINVGSFAW